MLVDPTTGEVVVPGLSVPHDEAVLAALDRDAGRAGPGVAPGRYPIVAWHLAGDGDATGRLSTALAVATAFPLVRDRDDPAGIGRQLTRLFANVPTHGFTYGTPAEVARVIASSTAVATAGAA